MLALEVPDGTRLEYKLDVVDSFGNRFIEDPLNPNVASHPFGANSVCEATGLRRAAVGAAGRRRPDAARTPTSACGATPTAATRRSPSTAPPPSTARHRSSSSTTAATTSATPRPGTVLDNLVHGGVIPPIVAAFVQPHERLVEYADDPRHATYLTKELRAPAGGRLRGTGRATVALPGRRQLRCRRLPVGGGRRARLLRPPAAAVRLVRRRRPRLPSAPRTAVATGPAIRRRVPGPTGGDVRAGLRQLRCLRVVDLREPRVRSSARRHRHGRPLRRVPRRAQLGLLARHHRPRSALAAAARTE